MKNNSENISWKSSNNFTLYKKQRYYKGVEKKRMGEWLWFVFYIANKTSIAKVVNMISMNDRLPSCEILVQVSLEVYPFILNLVLFVQVVEE